MSTGPEPEVRYVVAGMPTGWAAVWKTVRELDEDKVKDYKEDIDTLLVFTGLFSAVLTAFLIVSYPMLSPDPQDTVVQHLAQTSSQTHSYVVTAGTMNSTVPPLSQSSQPFTPSLTALRVNYCWFGSLIAALVTASFAILVKQWLREYLAYDYTSPQERLRARHFRHPGIAGWKVYEIAGALPLFLQVALGLFFLGLCFFTRSEHHGIGDMCSVLVALWASFLVTATMAPAFSPRCPYKTPFLKPVMRSLRRKHVIHIPHYCRSIGDKFITAVIHSVFHFLGVFHRYLQDPQSLLRIVITLPACAIHAIYALLCLMAVILYSYTQEEAEEAEATKQITNEVSILTEVDAFFHDDELLGTTMLDCLAQSKLPDVIGFVLHAISLRLEGDALRQPLSSPPDLRRLSKRAWIAVSDIVAAAVKNGLQAETTTIGSCVQDTMYLLFSVSEQQYTQSARSAIFRVCQDDSLSLQVMTALGFYPLSSATPTELLEAMSKRSHELLSEQDGRSGVVAVAIRFLSYETSSPVAAPPFESTLDLGLVSEVIWQSSSSLLAAAIEADIGAYRKGQKIGSWLQDAIYVLLSRPHSPPCKEALTHLFSDAALRKLFASCILSSASSNSNIFDSDTFLDVIRKTSPDETVAFLHTMVTNAHPATPALLVSWQFSSDFLGTMIKGLIKNSQEIGPWLEDAICILLSCPTSYPPMQASNKAMIGLYRSATLGTRFGSVIQSLVRPIYEDYQTVIRNLGEVCKDIEDGPSANFLLRTIACIFCTEGCKAKHSTPLAPSLAYHAFRNKGWTKRFSWMLVERVSTIPPARGSDWPPGFEESLWALMSLPAIPNLAIPRTVFEVIFNPKSSAAALRPLVSADPEWRSRIVQNAAIQCITSLVKTANSVDQANFVSALLKACNEYRDGYEPNSEGFEWIGTINPVRHLSLASKIHIYTISGNETGSDSTLLSLWTRYYTACARAMSIFKTEKYSELPAEEQQETVRIAEECLVDFDQSEPSPEDLDESKVDLSKTRFPDVIFQKLAGFVADADAAARSSWRVRRFKNIPSVAVHEPAHGVEAPVGHSPEHAESSVAGRGGDGPGGAGPPSNATSKPPVSSAQETEGIGATSQNDGGEDPGTEVSDGGKVHSGSASPNPPASATQEESLLSSGPGGVHNETTSGLVAPYPATSRAGEVQADGGVLSDAAQQHAEREGLRGDEILPASTSSDALGSSARGRGESGMTSHHGPENATSRGDDRTGDIPSAPPPQETSMQQRDASSTGNPS